jgi:sec-independent protein translocase protein TatB
VFNLQGSELVALILIALVVLGPEKLPDAIRRFGKLYGELKKMSSGFQNELKSALDEPLKEMRETADLIKKSTSFSDDSVPGKDGKGETLTDIVRRATSEIGGAASTSSVGAAAAARRDAKPATERPGPFDRPGQISSASAPKPAPKPAPVAADADARPSPFAAPTMGAVPVDLPPPGATVEAIEETPSS